MKRRLPELDVLVYGLRVARALRSENTGDPLCRLEALKQRGLLAGAPAGRRTRRGKGQRFDKRRRALIAAHVLEHGDLCPGLDEPHTKPDEVAWSVDHVVPLVLGGSNAQENLAVLCVTCNLNKAQRDLLDWLRAG